MKQAILHVALVVRDYDEAIDFYCNRLRFTLVEDTYQPEQGKRWVLVAPPGPGGTCLLLARASTPDQEAFHRKSVRRARLPLSRHRRLLARLPRDARRRHTLRQGTQEGLLRDRGRLRRSVREPLGSRGAAGGATARRGFLLRAVQGTTVRAKAAGTYSSLPPVPAPHRLST